MLRRNSWATALAAVAIAVFAAGGTQAFARGGGGYGGGCGGHGGGFSGGHAASFGGGHGFSAGGVHISDGSLEANAGHDFHATFNSGRSFAHSPSFYAGTRNFANIGRANSLATHAAVRNSITQNWNRNWNANWNRNWVQGERIRVNHQTFARYYGNRGWYGNGYHGWYGRYYRGPYWWAGRWPGWNWGYGLGYGYGNYYGYWPYYGGYYSGYPVYEGSVAVTEPAPSQSEYAETEPSATTDEGAAYFNAAAEAFQAGNYHDALRLANHAAVESPDNPKAAELMSLASFALGDYQAAAATAHAALAMGPPADWSTLFGYYGDAATYTKQLRALEKYSNENDSAADAHFLLGYQYLMTGYPKDAGKEFGEAANLQPQDTLAAELAKQYGGEAAAPAPPPAPPTAAGPGEV